MKKNRSRVQGNVWLRLPVWARAGIAMVIGAFFGVTVGFLTSWEYTPLVTFDVAALVLILCLWLSVRNFSTGETKEHATQEDPGRGIADAILLLASVGSLAAVFVLIAESSNATGLAQILEIALGLSSVAISWVLVHTVHMLRYADIYFEDTDSIDFGDEEPTYLDFAYVAFTIGMTYQVSDTQLSGAEIRRVALQHALLSFVFGTAIIATTINFVAGLGK